MGFVRGDFCVFCGLAIGADDETVGRGSATAHAACADSALADDLHWDRIAEQSGETGVPREPDGRRSGAAPTGRAGCLTLTLLPAAVALGLAAASAGLAS